MNKNISLLALAAMMAAVAATGAHAADLAPPPPPAPEIRPTVADWTGPYLGAGLGGACLESTMDITTYDDDSGNADGVIGNAAGEVNHVGKFDNNGCGFTGGFIGGFNYQIDNVLLGIEGDFMWGSKTGKHNEWQSNTYTEQDRYKIKWQTSVRLRAGVVVNDDTLFFATGGIGWMRGELSTNLPDHNAYERTHRGYVIGGGIEHAITENLHLRAEYLFSSYNSKSYGRYGAGRGTDGNNNTNEADVIFDPEQLHTFRVGITWNFPVSSW